jgi:hypothetical protein
VRKRILIALTALLAAWCAFGVVAWRGRAARREAAATLAARAPELRGAYHVHTTASDGRQPLEEVVREAARAGLRFLVVTDHNVRVPEHPAYMDGVLVVPGTEASTRYGHVVVLGTTRALTKEERAGDPLGAIRTLGGEAVLAHPLHPRRPFTGWGTGPWRGLEVVSNDTAWHRVLADRELGKALAAALVLPWDPPRAVLDLLDDPSDELALFDAQLANAPQAAPISAASTAAVRPPRRVLLCSADAHGYPSYRAAFEAFSMHLPIALSGDAEADARAVTAALLDGRGVCVLDGVRPAAGVHLDRVDPGRFALRFDAQDFSGAEVVLVRQGVTVDRRAVAAGGPGERASLLSCDGRCAPGDYRAEVRQNGQPWIFTNPVTIE